MADPVAQTVTLDASQFISATQAISASLTSLDKSFEQVANTLTAFNQTSAGIDSALSKLLPAMNATATATTATALAMNKLNASQSQMLNIMTQMAISTRASAVSLDTLAEKASASTKTVKTAADAGNSFTVSWSGIARMISGLVIRDTFRNFYRGAQDSIIAMIDFQDKLGLISSLSERTGTTLDALTNQVFALSTAFNQPFADVAKASLEAFRQGLIEGTGDFNNFVEVNRLAQATGQESSQIVQSFSAVMRGFGLATSEASRVSGIFNLLWTKGFNTNDVENTLGRLSINAREVGVTIEELAGTLLFFRKQGESTASSMTQLTAIIRALHDPNSKLSDLLRENGFATAQQAVEQLKFAGVLKLITKAVEDGRNAFREYISARNSLGGIREGGLEETIAQAGDRATNATNLATQAAERLSTAAGRLKKDWNDIKNIIGEDFTARLVSGLGIAVSIIKELFNEVGGVNQGMRRFQENLIRSNTDYQTSVSNIRSQVDALVNSARDRGQSLFNPLVKGAADAVSNQASNVQRLKDSYSGVAKSIIAELNAVLSGFNSIIKRNESEIQNSLQRVAAFADKTESQLFNKKFQAAGQIITGTAFTDTPQGQEQQFEALRLLQVQKTVAEQQGRLLTGRISTLTEEANALFARGDEVSVASARRKFEEIRRLTEQQFEIQRTYALREAEYTLRLRGGGVQGIPLDTRREESRLRDIDNQEASNEARLRDNLTRQSVILRGIVDLERQRVIEAEKAATHVSSFRITDSAGALQENFRGTQGGVRALSEFDQRAAAARTALETARTQAQADIQNALTRGAISPQQAEQLTRALPTEENMQQLIRSQNELRQGLVNQINAFRLQTAIIQSQDLLRQTIDRLRTSIDESITRVAQQRQFQQDYLGRSRDNLESLRPRVSGSLYDSREEGEAKRGIRVAIAEAIESIEAATRNRTPSNVESAVAALARVRDLVNTENARRQGTGEAPISNIQNLTTIISNLRFTIEALQRAEQDRTRGINNLGSIEEMVRTAIGNTPQTIGEVGAAATRLSIIFDELNTNISNFGISVDAIVRQLQALPNAEGQAPGFASGGLIGNSFSSMGPDNTTVNARRGEFIVNPDSTRQFYATLVAINRGDNPRGGGYSSGGTVNNSIGNMHFNINGANSPEQTAREVMKVIRREQRRGNV